MRVIPKMVIEPQTAARTFLSHFSDYPRSKSIILGPPVAFSSQSGSYLSTSLYHILMESPLLRIRSDTPLYAHTHMPLNCSPIMLTSLGIGSNGYRSQLPKKRKVGSKDPEKLKTGLAP